MTCTNHFNKLWLLIACLVLPTTATASWWNPFTPKTYDECILHNMQGVKSDTAAQAIVQSCYKEFNKTKKERTSCTPRDLTKAERANISANVQIGNYSGPTVFVNMYNGNADLSITDVTVQIAAPNIDPPQKYKLYLGHPIGPLSSEELNASLEVLPKKGKGNARVSLFSIQTCQ